MSATEHETNAASPKLVRVPDAGQFKIDPDIATACAYAVIALVAIAYVAIKFPQWSAGWAW